MEPPFPLAMAAIVLMTYSTSGGETKAPYESNKKMSSKWIDI